MASDAEFLRSFDPSTPVTGGLSLGEAIEEMNAAQIIGLLLAAGVIVATGTYGYREVKSEIHAKNEGDMYEAQRTHRQQLLNTQKQQKQQALDVQHTQNMNIVGILASARAEEILDNIPKFSPL